VATGGAGENDEATPTSDVYLTWTGGTDRQRKLATKMIATWLMGDADANGCERVIWEQ
jgi:hypothetical protein